MAIKDIDTKCWILALFVRDDGERFLLGDGSYEFDQKQLHFVANAMANDVVEVQGNDGYLLAGQVRRPSTQSFDGYVGDSSTSKAMVEERRRAFFAFFRKNHFYKVIYVFPDGSAIQRKRGFLVDAPEVKELWQIYPKYHVALNFEDINYYYYDEDADGEEIYGKSATINLNSATQTGGLIWVEPGRTSISEEGTNFTVAGTLGGGTLSSLQLKGDTDQTTYSGKNLFDSYTLVGKQQTGIISVSDDGTITLTGNTNSNGYCRTLGYPLKTFAPSLVVGQTYYLYLVGENLDRTNIYLVNSAFQWGNGQTRTITQTDLDGDIVFYGGYNRTTTFKVMITTTADTDFEPYVGGTASPNPDYPQEVQAVTGEQTVTITDGAEESQEYTVDLGNIELCKIGDYQDYIYKSGDDWYVHKATNRIVLNGTGNYTTAGDGVGGLKRFVFIDPTNIGNVPTTERTTYCDIWQGVKFSQNESTMNSIAQWSRNGTLVFTTNSTTMTLPEFGTFLRNSPVAVYLIPPSPTDTKITDNSLMAQLEALAGATTYSGQTVFTVDGNGNLAAILSIELEITGGGGVLWDENGAVWEEGKPSYSMVAIDSIDNVYPVLTIAGRTVDPILTDVTTGMAFQYNGTITESQVLRIDMLNKTATLNGTSVVGNVTGDWLYLAPGNNRITYTADNADAPNATLEWQEIVG